MMTPRQINPDWFEIECQQCGQIFPSLDEDERLCSLCQRINAIKADPEKYLQAAGIAPRYIHATIDNMTLLPEKYRKAAKQYAKNPKGGLYLVGTVGCGKTYFASAVARELILQGRSVLFYPAPQLLENIRIAIDEHREHRIVERCKNVEYLILDDLGAEHTTPFVLEKLYLIIDHRYRYMMPIIVTSNLSLRDLGKQLHDRLASRLSEMCKTLIFPHRDLRLDEVK